MEEIAHITKIFEEADCLVTKAEVESTIAQLAEEMTLQFKEANPLLLCIMRGGLILTAKLLEHLQFPLELDYVHVTRYQNGVTGTDTIEWRAHPQTELENRTVILIDDILDVGHTLKAVIDSPELNVAKEIYSAVLIDKQHQRKADPDFKADFTGMTVEDRYLFGYGLDYKGYLRNAPGIFAVRGL